LCFSCFFPFFFFPGRRRRSGTGEFRGRAPFFEKNSLRRWKPDGADLMTAADEISAAPTSTTAVAARSAAAMGGAPIDAYVALLFAQEHVHSRSTGRHLF
jgi:hypothetical protein